MMVSLNAMADVVRRVRIQATTEGVDQAAAQLKGLALAQGEVAVAAERQTRSLLPVPQRFEAVGRSARAVETSLEHFAMGLASGRNPFELMARDGLHLSAVLSGGGGGIAGALRAIGTTFVESVFNPTSIMIGGFVAADAAVGALWDAITAPERKVEETIKANETAVDGVVKAWALARDQVDSYHDSVKALPAFNLSDQIRKINEGLKLQDSAVLGQLGGSTGPFGGSVTGTRFSHATSVGSPFGELTDQVHEFMHQLADGTADFTKFMDRVATYANLHPNDSGLQAFVARLEDMTKTARDLEAELAKDTHVQALIGGPLPGLSSAVPGYNAAAIAGLRGQLGALHMGSFDDRFDPTAVNKRDADQAIADAKRRQDAIDKVSDSLRFQTDQLGRSDREQMAYNAVNQAGIDITSKAGQAIADQARHLYDLQKASEAAQKAQEELTRRMDDVRSTAKDTLSTFVNDIENGTSASQALADSLGKIKDKLIDMAENSIIDVLFGNQGTTQPGVIGSFLSGLGGGGGAGAYNPGTSAFGFHTGGVVGIDGTPRMVHPAYFDNAPRLHSGLMPDEFPAILQRGERVIPKSGNNAAGGTMVTINQTINVQGSSGDSQADARYIEALRREMKSAAREVIDENLRLGGRFNPIS